ncbi:MAG: SpoIIE family protein phosphatase [Bacteroidetes bacterium]|nr:SpoIIE family protein phosphatase [Bacteroidota bacterium]
MVKKETHSNRFLIDKLKNNEVIDNEHLKSQFISLYHSNEELTSSLRYAQIIQSGVLPKIRHFNRLFDDFLILYKPQSYVSGDFYWIGEVGRKVLFAVGDCTGHGVPGAMLTMLAQSFLNHIILGKQLSDTSLILKEFDKKFIETFQGENDNFYSNDWIDIALCSFDKDSYELEFAGAKRKILIVNKHESKLIKGNNYPLGGWQIEKNRNFETHKIELKKGNMIYLGSDGFQDQIGGEKAKKFGSKQLHDILVDIYSLPCEKQLMILKNKFKVWKQGAQQLDDVCIMGIRI